MTRMLKRNMTVFLAPVLLLASSFTSNAQDVRPLTSVEYRQFVRYRDSVQMELHGSVKRQHLLVVRMNTCPVCLGKVLERLSESRKGTVLVVACGYLVDTVKEALPSGRVFVHDSNCDSDRLPFSVNLSYFVDGDENSPTRIALTPENLHRVMAYIE